MSDDAHQFQIEASWSGDSESGTGYVSGSAGETPLDFPVHLGGKAGRANPEELLMEAVAGCYILTLITVAERRKVPVSSIKVSANGQVVRQAGGTLKFVSLQLRPRITLMAVDESQQSAARDLAHKAELYCPISNAIRGNVEITVEPEIVNS